LVPENKIEDAWAQPFGRAAWLTARKDAPPPPPVTMPNMVVLSQTVPANVQTGIHRENGSTCPAFLGQGHGSIDPLVIDYLLVIHGN